MNTEISTKGKVHTDIF